MLDICSGNYEAFYATVDPHHRDQHHVALESEDSLTIDPFRAVEHAQDRLGIPVAEPNAQEPKYDQHLDDGQ